MCSFHTIFTFYFTVPHDSQHTLLPPYKGSNYSNSNPSTRLPKSSSVSWFSHLQQIPISLESQPNSYRSLYPPSTDVLFLKFHLSFSYLGSFNSDLPTCLVNTKIIFPYCTKLTVSVPLSILSI